MRHLFIISVAFLLSNQLLACDICGCSGTNYFLGPSPQFSRHFVGFRYSFRSFSTVLQSDSTQFSNDFYQTAEFWSGIKIKNRFQVLTYIPYNINQSRSDDGYNENDGFGDITLIANYNLLNKITLSQNSQTNSQHLWIGLGIKLPTGKFQVDPDEFVASANSQTGSGSVDFLANLSYSIVRNNWGMSSNLSYKINEAASGFKFGNRLNAAAFGFHSFNWRHNAISPNVGLLFENLESNKADGLEIASTKGEGLLAAVGLEARFDKIAVGCNAQLPLAENISDSQTKTNLRGMVHITYAF